MIVLFIKADCTAILFGSNKQLKSATVRIINFSQAE
jgi:hypothetical protein